MKKFVGTYKENELLAFVQIPADCADCLRVYFWAGTVNPQGKLPPLPCGPETFGGRPILKSVKKVEHQCYLDQAEIKIHFDSKQAAIHREHLSKLVGKKDIKIKKFIKIFLLKKKEKDLDVLETWQVYYSDRGRVLSKEINQVQKFHLNLISPDGQAVDENAFLEYRKKHCP